LDRITQAVRGNLAPFKFPNPDVRVSCDPEAPSFTILIWPTPVTPNSCNDLARRRAELPSYMNRHGAFGIYIAAALIRNLAQAAFDATPKRLDGSGAPSPDGPIHLTGLLIDFVEHDVNKSDNSTIVTYLNGYDERPWPDVGFTVTLTDVLTSDPTLHAVTTSKVTTSDRDEFLALNLLPIAFVLSILPPTTFLLLNDLEAYQVRPHDSSTDSLGDRILKTIPDEISLPHTGGLPHPLALPRLASAGEEILTAMPESRKMVVISYGTPIVNDSGIYLSGAVPNEFPNRVPKARIIGPTSLVMDLNATQTFGYFSVEATEFYGKLSFIWSAGPDANIPSPNARSTAVFFRWANAQPGNSLEATVSVRVTDTDGSSVTTSHAVTVSLTDQSDGLSTKCKIRPWLDDCQPPS
jgi:hypothetical protein